MSITKSDVDQIATLARLKFTPAEAEAMARDLGSILEHMRELEAVASDAVEPMGGASDHAAPMRLDEPGADPLERPVEEIAPEWADRFFVVPRLAALDADAMPKELGG
ncbi:MAG: Asp-tRNA(Asn)/Glu-tRNA(Gln) amidotransferase subunit GatC [Gemmatimonas sp.]|nr:Asp-tRNA(Asn)/Glu-tRNA(Gln) amidotransferase subunit GatC [Gemmatimonas sp.]